MNVARCALRHSKLLSLFTRYCEQNVQEPKTYSQVIQWTLRLSSSNQCGLCEAFFRSARYFRRASLNETPPMKNALAARPIAYVPAPAIMPQTTLPQPG